MHPLLRTIACALLAAGVSLVPGTARALDLDEAMERAASNTEAAERLRIDIDAADARRRTALGALMPTLDASLNLTLNDREITVGDSTFTNQIDTSAQVQGRMDLFRGPVIPLWLAARSAVDSASLRAHWERSRLRMMAADAYLTALTAGRNLDAALENEELARQSFEQAEARRDTGFGIEADVALARVSLIDAEADRVTAERLLADALDELAFLVVADELTLESLTSDGETTPTVTDARERTADLRALDTDIDAAERRVQAEWWSFLPTATLVGTWNVGATSLRAPDGRYWTISLNATWRIFDFSRYGRLDEARASRDMAGNLLDEAERARLRDLRIADRRVGEAETRLGLLIEAAAAAEESRELVATRFELGEATALELTQADNALFRTRTRLNLATLELARAALYAAWIRGALQDEDSP